MYIVTSGNAGKLKYSSGKSEQRKLWKSASAADGPFTNTIGDNGSALLIKKSSMFLFQNAFLCKFAFI
jgi:hypothetical protein